jgi:hypothetical protein
MQSQYRKKINQCCRTWTRPATLCTFICSNRDRFNLTLQQSRPSLAFRPPHPCPRSSFGFYRVILSPVKIGLSYEMFSFSEEERWAMLLTTFAGLSTSLGAIIAVRYYIKISIIMYHLLSFYQLLAL